MGDGPASDEELQAVYNGHVLEFLQSKSLVGAEHALRTELAMNQQGANQWTSKLEVVARGTAEAEVRRAQTSRLTYDHVLEFLQSKCLVGAERALRTELEVNEALRQPRANRWTSKLERMTRDEAEKEARSAQAGGCSFDGELTEALRLSCEGDYGRAASCFKKCIALRPERPAPYFNLAVVLERSGDEAQAAHMYLQAKDCYPLGSEGWANATAGAFELLNSPACAAVPKPEWWSDSALKTLSEQVIAVPSGYLACCMRARVLSGKSKAWGAGPRTAAELREAAMLWRRAAEQTKVLQWKQRDKCSAEACDRAANVMAAREAEERTAEPEVAVEAEAPIEAPEAQAQKETARMAEAEARAAAMAEKLLAEVEAEKAAAAVSQGGGGSKGKAKGKSKVRSMR